MISLFLLTQSKQHPYFSKQKNDELFSDIRQYKKHHDTLRGNAHNTEYRECQSSYSPTSLSQIDNNKTTIDCAGVGTQRFPNAPQQLGIVKYVTWKHAIVLSLFWACGLGIPRGIIEMTGFWWDVVSADNRRAC